VLDVYKKNRRIGCPSELQTNATVYEYQNCKVSTQILPFCAGLPMLLMSFLFAENRNYSKVLSFIHYPTYLPKEKETFL